MGSQSRGVRHAGALLSLQGSAAKVISGEDPVRVIRGGVAGFFFLTNCFLIWAARMRPAMRVAARCSCSEATRRRFSARSLSPADGPSVGSRPRSIWGAAIRGGMRAAGVEEAASSNVRLGLGAHQRRTSNRVSSSQKPRPSHSTFPRAVGIVHHGIEGQVQGSDVRHS
jgi:hypothetical protein